MLELGKKAPDFELPDQNGEMHKLSDYAITEISRFRIINGFHLYNTLGAPIVIYIASDLMQLYIYRQLDRKSTRLNSSHSDRSRMPSSA